jgi:DNA mismatch repair protein MutL
MNIKRLSPQLANQIAAGEVVERPASMVKELVENSLDAQATRILIDIERGGIKRISVHDNGQGIAENDLPLALERHATSKISTLQDLDNIDSFGFRGEALASMASVSRLTISSCPPQQATAYQMTLDAGANDYVMKPCAHPHGTTIEIVDLFYNTPARRRFLKSERTEFMHIDDWVCRIALANPTVYIELKHQGKVVRRFNALLSHPDSLERLAHVFGSTLTKQAVAINCKHHQMSLSGHLFFHDAKHPLMTYFYVNHRVIRDKVVMHAIRQTLQQSWPDMSMSYCLNLVMDPINFDINVHPAKHEVRFHQSRTVHDFMVQALTDAITQVLPQVASDSQIEIELSKSAPPPPLQTPSQSARFAQATSSSMQAATEPKVYRETTLRPPDDMYTKLNESFPGKLPSEVIPPILDNQYFVDITPTEIRLLSIAQLTKQIVMQRMMSTVDTPLTSRPLLIPVTIDITDEEIDLIQTAQARLMQLGFNWKIKGHRCLLLEVAAEFTSFPLADWFMKLVHICVQETSFEAWAGVLTTQMMTEKSPVPTKVWYDLQQLSSQEQARLRRACSTNVPWRSFMVEQESCDE